MNAIAGDYFRAFLGGNDAETYLYANRFWVEDTNQFIPNSSSVYQNIIGPADGFYLGDEGYCINTHNAEMIAFGHPFHGTYARFPDNTLDGTDIEFEYVSEDASGDLDLSAASGGNFLDTDWIEVGGNVYEEMDFW